MLQYFQREKNIYLYRLIILVYYIGLNGKKGLSKNEEC